MGATPCCAKTSGCCVAENSAFPSQTTASTQPPQDPEDSADDDMVVPDTEPLRRRLCCGMNEKACVPITHASVGPRGEEFLSEQELPSVEAVGNLTYEETKRKIMQRRSNRNGSFDSRASMGSTDFTGMRSDDVTASESRLFGEPSTHTVDEYQRPKSQFIVDLEQKLQVELTSEGLIAQLEAMKSQQMTPDQTALEYVRLAWRCYQGSFTAPSDPKDVADALMASTQSLSPEQLDHNVHALLSTFWEVPVIPGTAKSQRRGFVDPLIRAQLSLLVGAPPFRLISWKQLQLLGRVPRSTEGHARTLQSILQSKCATGDDLVDDKGNPLMQIYMISHTWHSQGHPDGCYCGKENAKARVLIAFGEYTAKEFNREVWFWIDYCCIDQDNVGPGIRSLPLYVCSCSSFLVLHTENYDTRAWTLLEQCLFMSIGTKPAMTVVSVDDCRIRSMRPDTNGIESYRTLLDPMQGALSNEGDRALIGKLVSISEELWSTGWIEPPDYWSGEQGVDSQSAGLKFGPGLKGMSNLSFSTTEVMVRWMGLFPNGLHVIKSKADGTRELLRR